jgi:hypothetical protein
MNEHPMSAERSAKKKKVLFTDATKKRLVITLERDKSLCVLLHPRDLGIELRVKKSK